jgi:anti-sigma regulatory factor (Ser/Thr protein kinase)
MATAEAQHACDGRDGYRHEAFFYDGASDFMGGIVPFVRDAIAAEEPTLVVLAGPKIEALREALGGDAEQVLFADMAEVGANPARIIPAWQRFLDDHAADGRRTRGIGEPIWAGRTAAELVECERHEALLNIAFSEPSFWLLCPYDTGALPPEVIDEARRNHPYVSGRTTAGVSAAFPGAEAFADAFGRPLPEPPADAVRVLGTGAGFREIRHFVTRYAAQAGMAEDRAGDLALTVHELVANSVRHGGGDGTLLVWREADAVVCEVRDRGRFDDPLVGRVEPSSGTEGGRGLWMANQLCELVQIRSFSDGATVRVHKRIR